jgi:hypothetical protein
MKKVDHSKMAIEELLDLYTRFSIEQGNAAYVANTSRVNRIGDALYLISNEIRRRSDDRGRSMLKLFEHPNAQVRFNAAASVSGVFPKEARQAMQDIADSKTEMLAFDAKMYLHTLDEWIRKEKQSQV